jgi:hypothetical protein
MVNFIWILIGAGLLAKVTFAAENEIEIESLRSDHLKWLAKIRSLSFEAETKDEVANWVFHRVRIMGDKRLVRSARKLPRLDWSDDPARNETLLSKDKVEVFWNLGRYHEIDRLDNRSLATPKLRSFWIDPYLESIGWWPAGTDSDQIPSNFVCKILERNSATVVSSNESLDGRDTAHVQEVSGEITEDIWFDLVHSGMVVKRVVTKRRDGSSIIQQRVNSDFREVCDDLWLPFVNEFKLIEDGKIVRDSNRKLSIISVNELSDDDFSIAKLPGTLTEDKTFSNRQGPSNISQVSGGEEILDDVCIVARHLMLLNDDLEQKDQWTWSSFLNLVGGLVVGFSAGAIMRYVCAYQRFR